MEPGVEYNSREMADAWPPVAPLSSDAPRVSDKALDPRTLDALARFIREDDETANTTNPEWLLRVIPTAAGAPFQHVDQLKHNSLYIFQHDRAIPSITVGRLRSAVADLPGCVLAARTARVEGIWSLIAGPPAQNDADYRRHWEAIFESMPAGVRRHTSPACAGLAEPVSIGHDPDAWLADSMPAPSPGAGALESEAQTLEAETQPPVPEPPQPDVWTNGTTYQQGPSAAHLEFNGGLPDDAVADEPDPPPPAPQAAPQGSVTDAVRVSLCYDAARSKSDMGPAEPLDDVIARWKTDPNLRRMTEKVGAAVADLAAAQAHLDSLDDDDPGRPEAEAAVAQAAARKKLAKLGLLGHTYGAVVSGPRNQSSIVRLSGLVPVDIDGEGESAADLRDRLGALPYVRAARVSVTRTGVHAVVPVDGMDMEAGGLAAVASFKRGVALVTARVLEDVGRTLDPAVSNPVSLLFECYDPDAIDNPACEHLVLEPVKAEPRGRPKAAPTAGQAADSQDEAALFREAVALTPVPGKGYYNDWLELINRWKAGGLTMEEADEWCRSGPNYKDDCVTDRWETLDPTETQQEAWDLTIGTAVKAHGMVPRGGSRQPASTRAEDEKKSEVTRKREEAANSEEPPEAPRRRVNLGPKPGDTGGAPAGGWPEATPEDVQSALAFLAAKQAGTSDGSFLAVGMCLKARGHGFSEFDAWAAAAGCTCIDRASRWNSFTGKDADYSAICGLAYKAGWRKGAGGTHEGGPRVKPDHDAGGGESAPQDAPDLDQDASDYAVAITLIASTPGCWRLVGQHLYFARLGRPFAKLDRDDPRTFRAIFPALRDLVHSRFPTKIKALSDRYCLGIARMLDTMTETPDMEALVPRLRVSATIAPENLAIYAGGRITRVSDGVDLTDTPASQHSIFHAVIDDDGDWPDNPEDNPIVREFRTWYGDQWIDHNCWRLSHRARVFDLLITPTSGWGKGLFWTIMEECLAEGAVFIIDASKAFTGGSQAFTTAQTKAVTSLMVCIREADKVDQWHAGTINGLVEHKVSIHSKGIDADSANRLASIYFDAGGLPNFGDGQGVAERVGVVHRPETEAMPKRLVSMFTSQAGADAIRPYLADRILALAQQPVSPMANDTNRADLIEELADKRLEVIRGFLQVGAPDDKAVLSEIRAAMSKAFEPLRMEMPTERKTTALIHQALRPYSKKAVSTGGPRFLPGLTLAP